MAQNTIVGNERLGGQLFSTGLDDVEIERVRTAFMSGQAAYKRDVLAVIAKLTGYADGQFDSLVDELKQLIITQRAISGPSSDSRVRVNSPAPDPEQLNALRKLFDTTSDPITPKISIKTATLQLIFPDFNTAERVKTFLEKVDSSYRVVGFNIAGSLPPTVDINCSLAGGLDTAFKNLVETVNKAYQLSMAVDSLLSAYPHIDLPKTPVLTNKSESPTGTPVTPVYDNEGFEIVQTGFTPSEQQGDLI